MNRKLLLIRHAITTAEKNYLLGKTDLPLSEEGRRDALRLKPGITIPPETSIISSALSRASQTAEILFPASQISVDERINEIDFGAWSGLTLAEISEQYPSAMSDWAKNPMEFQFPEGESVATFTSRIENFLESLLSRPEAIQVLVCHGGVIRFIICSMLRIDYSHHLAFDIRRPSLNLIDHDGKSGTLSGLNMERISLP